MKLRIQGNSIRLRVTQPELATLLAEGHIAETTRLGALPGSTLTYSLACAHCDEIEVQYSAGEIAVMLPWPVARHWAEESEVSIRASLNVGGPTLAVLIEKDFACLHGTEEENAGTFPNPKMPD
ncbi:MAG: hypothetical protein KGN79_13785 [Acidobacteriota bacterium]|nr:hypothetical protein [Acidobacteriota bacterium]